jgi:hypothetical protein
LGNELLDANYLGQVAQIVYWRDATSSGLSIKSLAAGRSTVTAARPADNANAIAGLIGRVGLLGWNASVHPSKANGLRVYAGFVAALDLGAVNPITIADEDWTDTMVTYGVSYT